MSKADMLAEAEQRVGRTLRDKWHLERLLGVGGMATVYQATHRNRSRAAVKVLHRSLSGDETVQRRFLREGYVANTVDHPGAVRVLDDDVDEEGSAFLVLELLEGETLEELWEREGRSLPLAEVLRIADELLDVLAAAHEKGIVHRDVKPDNVFVVRGGHVKLLDFGIARLADQEGSVMATSTGVAMGTPAFMAPEQARARWELVDARTDVWAVGATLFSLLSGRFVHVAETVNETLVAAATLPAPPVATLVPELPPAVAGVIDRALRYERDARFESARSAQLALRAAAAELGPEALASTPSRSAVFDATADTVSASRLAAVATDGALRSLSTAATTAPRTSAEIVPAAGSARAADARALPRWLLVAGAGLLVAGGVAGVFGARAPAPAREALPAPAEEPHSAAQGVDPASIPPPAVTPAEPRPEPAASSAPSAPPDSAAAAPPAAPSAAPPAGGSSPLPAGRAPRSGARGTPSPPPPATTKPPAPAGDDLLERQY